MTFYDRQGIPIKYEQWLQLYEPFYFLNGPTHGRRVNSRNQSSQFVENQVCKLLAKQSILTRQELVLAMAWKIGGLIDHNSSESKRDIVFLQSWTTTLKASGQFRVTDYSKSIPYLDANMDAIVNQVNQGNPKYLFDLAGKLEGIGKVYVLTILFFITHGRFPIYDKYAHIAAQAIYDGLPPESLIEYRAVNSWSDYLDYMNLLSDISNSATEAQGHSTMFITRPVDRSLWVYGHFFNEKKKVASSVTKGENFYCHKQKRLI